MSENSPAADPASADRVCAPDDHVRPQKDCALCQGPTCAHCGGLANGQRVCASCYAKLEAGLAAEATNTSAMLGAWGGGLLGALVGGGVWALVAVALDLEIGYLAIGVGFVAGWGVHLGAKKRKGRVLQVVSVICALLGLVLGKYFIVAAVIVSEQPELASWYFDPVILQIFTDNVTEFFSGFDLLWCVLALGAAVKVNAGEEKTLVPPRGATA
ncbi:MAG: hypothetical protein L6Q99_03350 [Planctomycetes bacterium]|nr:hypothetical protein [Planctomycetota bacterium]